jgi:hypothetical protein
MGDPALADPAKIVDFPYHNDPAHWPNKHAVYPIKGNYTLMVARGTESSNSSPSSGKSATNRSGVGLRWMVVRANRTNRP